MSMDYTEFVSAHEGDCKVITKAQFEEYVVPLLTTIDALKEKAQDLEERIHKNAVQAADRQSSLERQLEGKAYALRVEKARCRILLDNTPMSKLIELYVGGRDREELLDELVAREEDEE